ncbi:hypothetical protein RFI_15350 [Reticulomyxa filosa]|uniref:Uncharacterized protein n=1 Tax=Reticulomyxa filosa TaxID=46433 RepID=X6N7X4_RETFI|nr:hypothetical protein RFI_15350 [Reticulomyxa filosa]|eukprot:ETO21854.1 hypothetical protein RFI_15350 [Reticulomyxa filosa]
MAAKANEVKVNIELAFQALSQLPFKTYQSPCIAIKDEILICGGPKKRKCYSYHTIKNEYKLICEYPSNIKLDGHSVIELVNTKKDNTVILLSFGGNEKHTMVMNYASVWNKFFEANANYLIKVFFYLETPPPPWLVSSVIDRPKVLMQNRVFYINFNKLRKTHFHDNIKLLLFF